MLGGVYVEFDQPMPCYDSSLLIGRVHPPGDCVHRRKFLTDLRLPAHRAPQAAQR